MGENFASELVEALWQRKRTAESKGPRARFNGAIYFSHEGWREFRNCAFDPYASSGLRSIANEVRCSESIMGVCFYIADSVDDKNGHKHAPYRIVEYS